MPEYLEEIEMSEIKGENQVRPYEETFYPPVPGRWVKFLRTCVLWQLVRFAMINIKMLRMIAKSHH